MLLKFIDVFKFFSQVEFTEQQRIYELISVCILAAVLISGITIILIKKHRNNKNNKENEDGSLQKSRD